MRTPKREIDESPEEIHQPSSELEQPVFQYQASSELEQPVFQLSDSRVHRRLKEGLEAQSKRSTSHKAHKRKALALCPHLRSTSVIKELKLKNLKTTH
ncbi:uncharacterized protein PGTG_06155 [Puccinia graminis f. sp. tritici CRL 75-36-700-3]|uniref:Uncharacterized protein n=1 Tax=Puccinia graminis f. sp. tritici (strain CRL 75-36-700-3 / race SCCL) TaxID=418459 RepID=E3K7W0_PUCGT|nr:uncharacterized protein PGTG_06155 [Puccinia graminis f. sp. tritici CRL 75-36-700-3]EFP80199.2 hypothetical protein PGTG_06155 [Puccinia graminis f. sp. tritici CRL 75-36-700-3]